MTEENAQSAIDYALYKQTNQNSINTSQQVETPQNSAEINSNSALNQELDNSSFSNQIDSVLKGKYPKRDMLVISEKTPKVLQEIGLKDLPITMTQKHLYTMTNKSGIYNNVNYHDIAVDVIKQLPQALERPLNILKSDTKDGSVVVVTELSDNNGDIIVASIKIDGKGTVQDVRIDSNVLTSAYGKRNNYDYFMQDNIAKGNLLYDIDKGIIQKYNGIKKETDVRDRLQLPMRDSSKISTSDIPKNTSPSLGSNISQSNNKVKPLPTATNNYSMPNQENNVKVLPKTQKTMNPNEISQLKETNANTTPNIKNIKVSSGDGKSSFYDNVTAKAKILSEESRQIIKDNLDVEYYKEVTNVDSLTKAYDKLNNDGESEALRWFSNDSSKATNIDVAEGWILLKQYEDSKNYDGMVQVAKKMREIGTKAGQTVQMFNLLERLSPEGMVKYAQSELSEAYDHMVKNKSQEWIDKHKSDFDLNPLEVQYIVDSMNEISKMKDGYDKKVNFRSNTKTYDSQRELDISEKLFNEIENYKIFLEKASYDIINDETPILVNLSTNKPYSDSGIRKIFNYYIDKSGVPKIRMYDLRHTYVTTMMSEGWELYHISQRLGHKNYSTTVNKYGHIAKEVRKELAKTTDKYF